MNVQVISNASNPKRITSWMTSAPDKSWRSVLTDAPSSGYGLDEASCRFRAVVLIQINSPPADRGLLDTWPSGLHDFR